MQSFCTTATVFPNSCELVAFDNLNFLRTFIRMKSHGWPLVLVGRESWFKVVGSHMVTVTLGLATQTRHGVQAHDKQDRGKGRASQKGTGLSVYLVLGCCGRMKNRSNKAF